MSRTCAPTPCAFVFGRCEFCGAPEPKTALVTLCADCKRPTWRHKCDDCRAEEERYLRACAAARIDLDDDPEAEADAIKSAEARQRRMER